MNKYHVILSGSTEQFPKGSNFILHRKTLGEAQSEAKNKAKAWGLSVASVTFQGVLE